MVRFTVQASEPVYINLFGGNSQKKEKKNKENLYFTYLLCCYVVSSILGIGDFACLLSVSQIVGPI